MAGIHKDLGFLGFWILRILKTVTIQRSILFGEKVVDKIKKRHDVLKTLLVFSEGWPQKLGQSGSSYPGSEGQVPGKSNHRHPRILAKYSSPLWH